MSSSLGKYILSLAFCFIAANIYMVIKIENITTDIIMGVNLFYFIPITFFYILYKLYIIATRNSPS